MKLSSCRVNVVDNNIPVAADVDLMRGLVGLSIIGVEVYSGSSSSRDLQSDADSVSAAADTTVDSPCCNKQHMRYAA